jgi:metal-responsive CopG/Arc/MetJ family transcriptional regulator
MGSSSPQTEQHRILSVALPVALNTQLDAFCRESGLSRSSATRLALRAFLAAAPSAEEK